MIVFLKILLVPVSLIYAVVIYLRNLFFDLGIFKSLKVNAKVISVGNITLGGSGKTPLTNYIIKLLLNNNFKVGVLSRGYGRKSKGYKLVSNGTEILSSVEESGDEIYHTAKNCKIPAAVCENRVSGAKNLIDSTRVTHLVLDDAFQHRWIYRDLDIVVFAQRFLLSDNPINKLLLPSGQLREGYYSLRRADAIIVNCKFSEKQKLPEKITNHFQNKPVYYAKYVSKEFTDIKREIGYPLTEFEGQKGLVVCGIANPLSFINALNQIGVDTSNKLIFRDHKYYTPKEVQAIRKKFYSTNSHSVITTEKDAVKLANFKIEFDDIDIFYLKIEMILEKEEEFTKFLIKKIQYAE